MRLLDRFRAHFWAAALPVVCAGPVSAERLALQSEGPDRYEARVESQTYLELYQRALLPGPGGALIVTQQIAPVHQYLGARIYGLDLPNRTDALDVELSGWGRADLADLERRDRFDGDLTAANLRVNLDPIALKAGRQVAAGGGAGYLRFDGLSMALALTPGLALDAYAGFTVLPPATRRRGYQLLGASAESVRTLVRFENDSRLSSWVSGSRLSYREGSRFGVTLGYHHRARGGEIDRSRLHADGQLHFGPKLELACGGSAELEVDARRFADAHLVCDASPDPSVDLTAEVRRTEPALLLSRQSVLSVFSVDGFSETGGRAVYRLTRGLSLEGQAYLARYGPDELGGRTELSAKLRPEGSDRLLVAVGYTRLLAAENGYQVLRGSLRRRLWRRLVGTLEGLFYSYDEPIRTIRTSAIGAGTLQTPLGAGFGVLIGSSIVRSPYARLDAQGLLRVSYDLAEVRK